MICGNYCPKNSSSKFTSKNTKNIKTQTRHLHTRCVGAGPMSLIDIPIRLIGIG